MNTNVQFKSPTNRSIIRLAYSDRVNSDSKELTSLEYIKSNTIVDKAGNIWVNRDNLVIVAPGIGKVTKNCLYFPGHPKQALILDKNVLANKKEFTIAAWVLRYGSERSNTIVEIVPKFLFDLNISDMDGLDEITRYIIDEYKSNDDTRLNSIRASIFGEKEHNVSESISNIDNYIIDDWNYYTLSFKKNKFYISINGKIIKEDTANIPEYYNELSPLFEDTYFVIGASFLDDITDHRAYSMYIDDLVVYDKALFTSDFIVPTKKFTIDSFNSNIYNSTRVVYGVPTNVTINTKRYAAVDTTTNTLITKIKYLGKVKVGLKFRL